MHAWLDEGSLSLTRSPRSPSTACVSSAGTRRDIAGVLGAVGVVDLEAGGTAARANYTRGVTDRLELTRATVSNLSPVWGLSLAAGDPVLAEPGEAVGTVT